MDERSASGKPGPGRRLARRLFRLSAAKVGLPPGTIVSPHPEAAPRAPTITVIDYDETNLSESTLASPAACRRYREAGTVSWINVDGVHDVEQLQAFGEMFDLHPLVREDIAHPGQRPKAEEIPGGLFLVLNMLRLDRQARRVESEQLSLFLFPNCVLSFQERPGDIFDELRDRLRQDRGRVRKLGADYLLYCLLDAVVDQYFTILEFFGDALENMEEVLLSRPAADTLPALHGLKRELILLRKSVWPLREMVSRLARGETGPITPETAVFLRDVHDHAIQVIDAVETFRDMAGGLHDTYLTVVSNKMNEIMKVLTIIATIFIPLTFIAGIYGMNFENMPELKWPAGYFLALGLMVLTALAMLLFFRRRRWL